MVSYKGLYKILKAIYLVVFKKRHVLLITMGYKVDIKRDIQIKNYARYVVEKYGLE